jgi:hypothetical protein
MIDIDSRFYQSCSAHVFLSNTEAGNHEGTVVALRLYRWTNPTTCPILHVRLQWLRILTCAAVCQKNLAILFINEEEEEEESCTSGISAFYFSLKGNGIDLLLAHHNLCSRYCEERPVGNGKYFMLSLSHSHEVVIMVALVSLFLSVQCRARTLGFEGPN